MIKMKKNKRFLYLLCVLCLHFVASMQELYVGGFFDRRWDDVERVRHRLLAYEEDNPPTRISETKLPAKRRKRTDKKSDGGTRWTNRPVVGGGVGDEGHVGGELAPEPEDTAMEEKIKWKNKEYIIHSKFSGSISHFK